MLRIIIFSFHLSYCYTCKYKFVCPMVSITVIRIKLFAWPVHLVYLALNFVKSKRNVDVGNRCWFP